jgi:RNA polymerase sigma factor (sigma-70 family)
MTAGYGLSKDLQQQLIQECCKNNRRAQLKLYNSYAKAMYTICLNMVSDVYLAEELMQESFISAFKNIETFKGEVSFGAWLKKIVVNRCIDYLKKKKIKFESIENHQHVVIEDENEEERTILNHKIEHVKEVVRELPDGYRTILSLYLFEGYDHDEIAQILDITASTSRSQFTRAKALLVKRIKEA